MRRIRLYVTLLAAAGASCVCAQRLAVYESEANAEQYHGIFQEPLRGWLTERGLAFDVVGDEVAADPAQLGEYDLVLAASVYIVPDATMEGLTEYLLGGGRIIWLDSPARCRDEAFRAALGLGPNTAYAPLTDVTFRRLTEPHPAALATKESTATRFVANAVTTAAPEATVFYEVTGTAEDGTQASFPAVILSQPEAGKALVYNWIPRNPGQDSLLADGLDYMLADVRLKDHPTAMFASVIPPTVRQPEPIAALCKVYRRTDGAPPAIRLTASLSSGDGAEVASQTLEALAWTSGDPSIAAGMATTSIPTADLPDGSCTLRFRAAGGPLDETCEVSVELTGQRWAALREAESERRKLLEPLLLGTLGDYDSEPRTPEGRVDIPRLMEQIETAHMTMYDFLVWHAPTDWEDFQQFLPVAQEKGIKVWITLCPPSEQGNGMFWSEPYRLGYVKWADEIGKLAEQYDNLVALVIDDFWSTPNWSLFTPEYIAQVVETLRKHNPKVAFLPTIYWSTIGDAEWIETYGPLIDGIVFPYCEYVTGDDLSAQLAACRRWIGPDKFLLVNVYASGSGGGEAPPRTEAYMRKTLTVSREQSDGIRIYCLPKAKLLDDPVYAVTAELYGKWSAPGTP